LISPRFLVSPSGSTISFAIWLRGGSRATSHS